eukprot:TRINITY_DN2443_c0_g1_i1.p1 TRINITY_DN2443_c0_g1~~TRINITY_DN2443_c0_g1_i1.p1  ORF type:complete len:768 (-),score=102.31 TRINITY_DN2443_c0_g1_i1:1348-3651(-)
MHLNNYRRQYAQFVNQRVSTIIIQQNRIQQASKESMEWLFPSKPSKTPQKTTVKPRTKLKDQSLTTPKHSTSATFDPSPTSSKSKRPPRGEQLSSEGLLLFGRTVIQNQKQYKRLWTEKQHEKEIQELLFRREKLGNLPRCSKSVANFVGGDTEIPLDKMPELGENNDIFYILKETTDYLGKTKGLVKNFVKANEAMLFPVAKENSEISDIVVKERETEKRKIEEANEKINALTEENLELKSKLAKSNTEFKEASERVTQLEAELKATQIELHRKTIFIQKQKIRMEESKRASDIDYTAVRKRLCATLEENIKLSSALDKEKSLKEELQAVNKSLMQKLQEKSVNGLLVDQSCSTEPDMNTKNSANGVVGIHKVLSLPNVQIMIASMLQPEEVGALIHSSKAMYSSLSKNPSVLLHLLNQTTFNARTQMTSLQKIIEKLKDDDKRFAFLKKLKVAVDPEFNKLIDEYICKKKPIGSFLAKSILDSRNFIYTGDIQKKAMVEKKSDSSGGFFSGWGLSTVWNLALDVTNIPGTVSSKSASAQPEDDSLVIESIVNTEKHMSPETICGMLNKMATKIGSSQPGRMSQWINQLQLCFSMLFRGCMQFYSEAKDLEKLKNFLVDRLEGVKEKLKLIRKENEIMRKEVESIKEVGFYKNIEKKKQVKEFMVKKMKALDTQNLVLNADRIGYEKAIFLLRKEKEEESEAAKKTLSEYERNIRLLIKKIKRMKRMQAALEAERVYYVKEFANLQDCFGLVKDELTTGVIKSEDN